MDDNKAILNIGVEDDLLKHLQKVAEKEDISVEQLLIMAVKVYTEY